eukprot:gene33439-43220_t
MFSFVAVIIAALVVQSAATDYPNVFLEVYYEALCPGCQGFITGPLTNAMALPDIAAIIDLKMVPYGNTKKSADGTFTCQHGANECASDVIELCTLYKLSGNSSSINVGDTSEDAFPFVQCMEINEGDPSKAEGCFGSTLKKTSSLDWETVTTCAEKEGQDVQNYGAAATPTHDYVPWVLVDGTLLSNTNLLILSICKAYTGPSPASCRVAQKAVTAVQCAN